MSIRFSSAMLVLGCVLFIFPFSLDSQRGKKQAEFSGIQLVSGGKSITWHWAEEEDGDVSEVSVYPQPYAISALSLAIVAFSVWLFGEKRKQSLISGVASLGAFGALLLLGIHLTRPSPESIANGWKSQLSWAFYLCLLSFLCASVLAFVAAFRVQLPEEATYRTDRKWLGRLLIIGMAAAAVLALVPAMYERYVRSREYEAFARSTPYYDIISKLRPEMAEDDFLRLFKESASYQGGTAKILEGHRLSEHGFEKLVQLKPDDSLPLTVRYEVDCGGNKVCFRFCYQGRCEVPVD